jgi:hypothetical protein
MLSWQLGADEASIDAHLSALGQQLPSRKLAQVTGKRFSSSPPAAVSRTVEGTR